MRKLFILAIMVTVSMFTAHAQTGFRAGVHGAIPGGETDIEGSGQDVSDAYSLNLGADFSYFIGEEDLLYGGVISYSRFLGDDITQSGFGQTVTAEVDDISYIEIKAAGEYNFSDLFYGGVNLGYAFQAEEGDNEDDLDGGLLWMPKVGVRLEQFNIYGYYKSIEDEITIATYGLGVSYNF